MIEFFVRRPVSTLMSVMFFVLIGIVSYFNLNIEKDPSIDFPIVSVRVIYPGASPEDVEEQVLKKIEDSVVEVSEIKKIESQAYESFGVVIVEFNLGVNLDTKSIEVKDKVEAILNDLPSAIEKPIIEKVNPFSQPVMEIALTSSKHSGLELYDFADNRLRGMLTSVKGLAGLDIRGGRQREISVRLDAELMIERFITITDVINSMKRYNVNFPGGSVDEKDSYYNVRFFGEFETVDEIRSMVLTTREGEQFKLSDVARVEDSYKKVVEDSRFNGDKVVLMSLRKTTDGNAVEITNQIEQLWPNLEEVLEEGMGLTVASETTSAIIRQTDETIVNILVGIGLTVLVLLFFTGNFSLTLIASLVIPASIVSSIFLVDASQFSINSMTLLAIATALGTLIANAIVILESILKNIDDGKDSKQAAIDGTKQVAAAIVAASGTNLVVFTPIAFMGGIVGQFMIQFGLTVVFLTIFSIFASFTLTPMLAGVLLSDKKSGKKSFILQVSDKLIEFLLREYKFLFEGIMKAPWAFILISIGLLFGSLKLVPYIGNEFIPGSDLDRIQIKLQTPSGSTFEKTESVVAEVEQVLNGKIEIESVVSKLGENGTENADVIVNLKPSAERQKSDMDLINEWIPLLARIPDAEFELKRGSSALQADIVINVTGYQYDKMVDLSKKVEEILQGTGYFRTLKSSYRQPKREFRFIPDQEKLRFYGVSNIQLAQTIRASIYGDDSNKFKDGGEEYDVLIELSRRFKDNQKALESIFITSKKGMIPISKLGTIKRLPTVTSLKRRDRNRIIAIEGYLSKGTAGEVQNLVADKLAAVQWPAGYGFYYAGNAETQAESQREIAKSFLLATILTYMVLAGIMNSMLHPFTIATSILTSFSGVFVLLFFLEESINIASMLAMIMLVGLVVNNAILLLEFTMSKIEEGVPIKEALWLAVEDKFKAIMMTSIAIIAGALPQLSAIEGTKSSMGAVLIGGMLGSILFTFIMTPALFYYFEKLGQGVKKLTSRS
ncbi:efflux RND transporter permease subunit [Pseudobacteriovorax antillogorgiicola]|uniref:Hydrophobic/amphiphilic exporter-1, HAE1 family n=1 Tax=Pseudobacteriovorax antillogorgiicola TaxID=1513793 RepID=A0A1Y6BG32_9BACT|nr:efflux RND transporter permease subunit [Pseudobacteriovorax antillogorgiicola]TCS57392.1 HAE1 family hydrophobic/amphiphilic exporter-1 [Pseudobacteriovorax antillogorgiicola]SMF01648.1 hydrophobic/amphiphilic exporter-1, HAE1 family [Pseudobacteriovorax antillogorgiicola]